ncbi:MAG: Asp-tRNA(Asn)/Glu-tRNA(Gln) amidotransferase GatCAB subunit A, partial [Acidobacteriaceae bacterium]|nr:Asp-tRNA(Asn)/Glu-tRNA(Gln) amidotransferase GatCAB subunit A [Acidobacteriaceae bacterium]
MSVNGDIASLTIPAIREGLLNKKFSATELAQSALAFAQQENGATNAYLTFSPERALRAAAEVDARIAKDEYPGLMAGVPVGIKDVIVTQGLRTTCGSQ